MAHTLEISDDLYERLTAYATQQGQPVEAVAESLLAADVNRLSGTPTVASEAPLTEAEMARSPFLRMLGSLAIGEPGWADRHDELFSAIEDTERHAEEH